MAEAYDIEVYAIEGGKEPFNEWLQSLKDKILESANPTLKIT